MLPGTRRATYLFRRRGHPRRELEIMRPQWRTHLFRRLLPRLYLRLLPCPYLRLLQRLYLRLLPRHYRQLFHPHLRLPPPRLPAPAFAPAPVPSPVPAPTTTPALSMPSPAPIPDRVIRELESESDVCMYGRTRDETRNRMAQGEAHRMGLLARMCPGTYTSQLAA